MKRILPFIGASIMAAFLVMSTRSAVFAGRVEGPLSTVGTVPAAMSVYYDISFTAGDRAIVTIDGDGNSLLFVMIYDTDGHVAVGTGNNQRKTVMMDVYRSGVFRVEVRNLAVRDSGFTLTTN